jgi:hypothetical protein
LMVVTPKTSNKLIRIREFHIDYVGHAQASRAAAMRDERIEAANFRCESHNRTATSRAAARSIPGSVMIVSEVYRLSGNV